MASSILHSAPKKARFPTVGGVADRARVMLLVRCAKKGGEVRSQVDFRSQYTILRFVHASRCKSTPR